MESEVIIIDDDAELTINENNDLIPSGSHCNLFLTNRLGYDIEIKDSNGEWLNCISIVDDNGDSIHLKNIGSIITDDHDLNEVLNSIILRTISNYLPKTVRNYITCLKQIAEEYRNTNKNIVSAINILLTNTAVDAYGKKITPAIASNVSRQLVAYLIAYEYPKITIEEAEKIAGVRVKGFQNNYSKLFLMKDELGPFTREEMGIIQGALENDDLLIPLDSRIIAQLCADWGLRPIQISLLKEDDFNYNPQNDLYWLNVPRVKQKQRNRRTQFKKRLISNQLGLLIKQMIEKNSWVKSFYSINDMPLFQRRFARFTTIKDGVMKVNDKSIINPHREKYGEAKDSFSFHINTYIIETRLHEVEKYLPLSPRTGLSFNLTPYRFRYTFGTSLVAQGKTASEVAELLDHSNTDSVKHYFKNTEHLWEVIQEATTSRVEQGHFVAKFMTQRPQKKNIYAVDITERKTFTSVGKCHKGSACTLEPAVACYSCVEFHPNDNAEGHKKAKDVIIEFRSKAQSLSSTGEIQHVFDDALVGVEAAIVYADKPDDVLGITDCEPRDLNVESINPTIALNMNDE